MCPIQLSSIRTCLRVFSPQVKVEELTQSSFIFTLYSCQQGLVGLEAVYEEVKDLSVGLREERKLEKTSSGRFFRIQREVFYATEMASNDSENKYKNTATTMYFVPPFLVHHPKHLIRRWSSLPCWLHSKECSHYQIQLNMLPKTVKRFSKQKHIYETSVFSCH